MADSFDQLVANGTGLEQATVAAWTHAENGPSGNPLNIGPGRDYGSPQAAATATIALLHTPKYAAVIDTAKSTSDPRAELASIADSPWDQGTTGPKPGYLKLLLGSLATVQGSSGPGGVTGAAESAASAVGNAVSSVVDAPFKAAAGAVGNAEQWISKEAATALAYVVLTVLGLVLIVFGGLDFLGYSPKRIAAAAAAPAEGIPY